MIIRSRSCALPLQLQHLIQIRLASTTSSTTQFPYPTQPRPTPHQIFHLPHNASQQDIKARYYDLVRAHHPDSQLCRDVSPLERHARFQSIAAAYDILRGAKSKPHDAFTDELGRRSRAWGANASSGRRRRRHGHPAGGDEYTYWHGHDYTRNADDRWKDRVIVFVGIFTLAAGLAPGIFFFPVSMEQRHLAASANLARARKEAKADGAERRKEIKRRVAENKVAAARGGSD